MKKLIFMGALAIFAQSALADNYVGAVTVARIRLDATTQVEFGVIGSQPANTCSDWGEYFVIDTSTASGKNFYNTLLIAKLTNKIVDLWYSSSTTPGKDQTNGCVRSSMSLITGISIPIQ